MKPVISSPSVIATVASSKRPKLFFAKDKVHLLYVVDTDAYVKTIPVDSPLDFSEVTGTKVSENTTGFNIEQLYNGDTYFTYSTGIDAYIGVYPDFKPGASVEFSAGLKLGIAMAKAYITSKSQKVEFDTDIKLDDAVMKGVIVGLSIQTNTMK